MKIIKSINNSSILVQWDEVDNSLNATYVIWLSDDSGALQVISLIKQSSYTITGLALDTVYTITVTATNMCGTGPEYKTTISLSTGTTTPIISVISPTVTASLVTSACCTTTTNNILVSPTNDDDSVGTESKCSITI